MFKTLLQTVVFTLFTTAVFSNNSNFIFDFELKISLQNPCDASITPGQIGSDQVVCHNDNIPQKLEEISAPMGFPGGFEFLWIYTNTPPSTQTIVWYPINSATGNSFQPDAITETTWFRRCVRPVGCDVYTAESNIVKIEFEDCTIDCSLFTANISIEKEISCFGDANGSILAKTDGGTAPFKYEWSHSGLNNELAENLAEGTYFLIVTDANDCTATASVFLKNPKKLEVQFDIFPETCAGNDGAVYAIVTGGVAPYSFIWGSGMGSDSYIENVPAGHYVVWIQDANGCKYATEMTVQKSCGQLSIGFDNSGTQITENEDIAINWTIENEVPGSHFLIEKSRNNIDFQILCSMSGEGFEEGGKNYVCEDKNPFEGTNYYRIVHFSPETEKTYSETQSIYIEPKGKTTLAVYPNPVVRTATVNFLKPIITSATIQIFNQNGNPIQSVEAEPGTMVQNFDLSEMPSGQYLIYVETEDEKPEIHPIFKGE